MLGDQVVDYVGVINQLFYFFNMMVVNNVWIGNENVSDEQVWDVFEWVGLVEMIKKFFQGLEIQVDEVGFCFFGGECYCLFLVWILLKDVLIILLDELMVGLDLVMEQEVLDIFMIQLQGKILIWIIYYFQGVVKMDQVVFIEDGYFVMQGILVELEVSFVWYCYLLVVDWGEE